MHRDEVAICLKDDQLDVPGCCLFQLRGGEEGGYWDCMAHTQARYLELVKLNLIFLGLDICSGEDVCICGHGYEQWRGTEGPFSASASNSDGSANSLRSNRSLHTVGEGRFRVPSQREISISSTLHLLLVLFTVMVSMATKERKVMTTSWGNSPVVNQKVVGLLQIFMIVISIMVCKPRCKHY